MFMLIEQWSAVLELWEMWRELVEKLFTWNWNCQETWREL